MLSPYRVLDLSLEAGHLAGKILGDLGADVVKVEPPGGDPLRARGPFVGGIVDPARSIPWLAVNTSKRGVMLALDEATGQDALRNLVHTADVLLESYPPGTMEGWGLGYEALRAINPGLVYCAITPFGQRGPLAAYRGHDLVVAAMGGNAALTGHPEYPPLRCSQPASYYHAAPEAVVGIALALHSRERSGMGQLVDVSLQETQATTLLTNASQFALHRRPGRRSGAMLGGTREIWRAKDGWISFGLRGGAARAPSLAATVDYMTECAMAPQWLQDYDWQRYSTLTVRPEELARIDAAFGEFFQSRTMRELYEEALQRRILLAPCNNAHEIANQPQLRAREFFTVREYPELAARLEHPAFFAKDSEGSIGIRRNAPRLGEHDRELLAREDPPAESAAGTAAPGEAGVPSLAGVKVLELGAGAAGPIATTYFAQHGATVIRIESAKRPDFLRTLHVTTENRDQPGIFDKSPMFALLNPNKRSVTVNLKTAEGVALVKRLAAWADVVTENFAPGVMERWGLDYANLREVNPKLIMASGCLFGQTGPQRSYPGFGGQGSAISGFNHLTGRPESEAHGPFGTVTDALAPRYVALCLLAALLERRRTGRGRYIDLSQIETAVYSLSEMMVRHSATGEVLERCGNHCEYAAPHAIYPCAGEDRWIAIAVFDDAQWRRLVEVMDPSEGRLDACFDTVEGRLEHQAALDRAIGAWTRGLDAEALMARLQAAGVEAGVVQTNADLLEDPQLQFRGHFVPVDHPDLGTLQFERSGFRLSESPGRISAPGPQLGEHTESVLREELGLSGEEVEALRRGGVLT